MFINNAPRFNLSGNGRSAADEFYEKQRKKLPPFFQEADVTAREFLRNQPNRESISYTFYYCCTMETLLGHQSEDQKIWIVDEQLFKPNVTVLEEARGLAFQIRGFIIVGIKWVSRSQKKRGCLKVTYVDVTSTHVGTSSTSDPSGEDVQNLLEKVVQVVQRTLPLQSGGTAPTRSRDSFEW